MAKMSAHGSVLDSFETGTLKYSLMEDGVILDQMRLDGRLDTPTIWSNRFHGDLTQARLVFGHLKFIASKLSPTA